MELAQETIAPGELEATRRLIELLKRRLERDYSPPLRTLRDAHPKQHGLVRAEFIVAEHLPEQLRVGIFREAQTYPAWVRFSNMSGPPQPDIRKDSRGMALKLMNVEGEKLFEPGHVARTHDFVLMSTDFFVTKDVAAFADLVQAIEGGALRLALHLLLRPRLALLLYRTMSQCASPFEVSYGSTTPYRLGDQAVKYAVRPSIPMPTSIPASPADDFLRRAMVEHLKSRAANFDFLVQVQVDPQSMPIEDPRVVWSEVESPFVKVADVHISPQTFDTPAQHEFGDNLSFNPWRCLPEHRPLGGLNRARRMIYEEMSRFRHERNQAPFAEPTESVTF